MRWEIREEQAEDAPAVRALVEAAFRGHPHSDASEPDIIERLRAQRTPLLALVATEGAAIVGQVTFSPVTLADETLGWHGLGPLAVAPDRQGCGIGSALVRKGLARLEGRGAGGCVVLGEPGYYARFGFVQDHALKFPGAPEPYFQSLYFAGPRPSGKVRYAPAFG